MRAGAHRRASRSACLVYFQLRETRSRLLKNPCHIAAKQPLNVLPTVALDAQFLSNVLVDRRILRSHCHRIEAAQLHAQANVINPDHIDHGINEIGYLLCADTWSWSCSDSIVPALLAFLVLRIFHLQFAGSFKQIFPDPTPVRVSKIE